MMQYTLLLIIPNGITLICIWFYAEDEYFYKVGENGKISKDQRTFEMTDTKYTTCYGAK